MGTAFYAGFAVQTCSPETGRTAAAPVVAQASQLRSDELANIELFREAAPSVVYITTSSRVRTFFSRNLTEIPRGSGSGFIWDQQGHIVTNYHVIQRADVARVTLSDQSTWVAKTIGVAPEKDLAVLRIEVPEERLRPLPVGRSSDLSVGQNAFAIGNPFGLDYTLTTGVVSALGREIISLDRRPIRDVIQTDAAINPGNSGGPLLDSGGRLIGVNTQIYSPSGASAGIGFAIPVDTISWVVPDLIAYGQIQRPMLGVNLVSEDLLRRYRIEGAVIYSVIRGSGAADAGLRGLRETARGIVLGDIITAVEGEPVRSSNDLFLLMEKYRVGDTVTVTVRRDREERQVEVRLSRQQ